jgi:hypothetical protein
MTPESMQELNIQLFKRLAALTELAARPAYDADVDAGDALTYKSDSLQGTNSSGDQQQQQQQVHNSSNGKAAHPASTAAPAVRVGAASGTDPAASLGETSAASLRTAHAAALEHVEAYVDYANRLFILVQLHNPIALYAMAVNNLITNEPAVAPQQHWLMVSNIAQLFRSCRPKYAKCMIANHSTGCRRCDASCR